MGGVRPGTVSEGLSGEHRERKPVIEQEVTRRASGVSRASRLLNPLFLYAWICATILVLYALSWSALYAPLDRELAAFLIASIAVSIGFGLMLQGRIDSTLGSWSSAGVERRAHWSVTCAVVAGFLLQFLAVGQVPFLDIVLHGSIAEYGAFPQLPVVGVLLTTFAMFYTTVLAHRFIAAKGKVRAAFAAQFVAIELMFLLLLNRGAMVLSLIAGAIMLASCVRFSLRKIAGGLVATAVVLYAFGVVGNLRQGGASSDSSYIVQLAHLTKQFPHWLPDQFVWAYMYAVSPLGNLNHAVRYQTPLDDFGSTVINLIPDFATKRLFPDFDPLTPGVVSYFNVSTGFSAAWKFNGFLGLWITFFALVALVTLVAMAAKGDWRRVALALGGGMVTFMFFENTLSYSGVSFALAYPVLGTLMQVPVLRQGQARGDSQVGASSARYRPEPTPRSRRRARHTSV